jgi:hypothetical protein
VGRAAGPEGCRRLACDAAITRVQVDRQPTQDPCPAGGRDDHDLHTTHGSAADQGERVGGGTKDQPPTPDPSPEIGLQARLRAAMALLPPTLGGAPSQPLDVGRSTRVVQPAQRSALAVRDRGCVFPDCERPLAWCDAHHLEHWIDGPTDLENLALLCRTHHRTVHEGGWQLTRGPDGRFTATPPHRRHRTAA